MFLLVVDAFSKWPFVFDLGCEASTTKTVLCLLEVLDKFGIPDVIVSDNGPQFTSHEFRVFREQNGIGHRHHRIIPQLMTMWNGWSRR